MNASSKIRSHSTTGADGGVFVNTGTPEAGTFYAVQVIANNTKLSFEGNLEGWVSSTELPSNTTIYGRFDKVTVIAGSAILYKI
jgi:hypothetical protein